MLEVANPLPVVLHQKPQTWKYPVDADLSAQLVESSYCLCRCSERMRWQRLGLAKPLTFFERTISSFPHSNYPTVPEKATTISQEHAFKKCYDCTLRDLSVRTKERTHHRDQGDVRVRLPSSSFGAVAQLASVAKVSANTHSNHNRTGSIHIRFTTYTPIIYALYCRN